MLTMVCGYCGAIGCVVDTLPTTPLELAVLAQSLGWGVYTDHRRKASVACSIACRDALRLGGHHEPTHQQFHTITL